MARIGRVRILAAAAALGLALLLIGCGNEDDGEGEGGTELGYNEAFTPEAATGELLGDSGAAFARLPLSWAGVEPVPGDRDFSRYDAIADALARSGLRTLWVIGGAPCWAAVLGCKRQQTSRAPAPEQYEAYADFAAAVVERYPDSIGIEIWNEPNLPNFWRPQPDASAYRELLEVTTDRIRDEGSDVPVVLGAPSPVTAEQAEQDPAKIPFDDFLRQVLAGAGRPDVDAVGVHPYSLLQLDADPVERSLELYREAEAVVAAEAPELPLWVTEVGLTTRGRNSVSGVEQAEGLAEIYGQLAERGVPVVAVHRFFDQADPPFPFEAGFGVVAADRETPKPAYCALAAAAGASPEPCG